MAENRLHHPTLFWKKVLRDLIALRFADVGPKKKFGILLQRLREEFPLVQHMEMDNQAWWVVAEQQLPELKEFCRRNGLSMTEAS